MRNIMNRSQRCGQCRGCTAKPCGHCIYCQDSPQFGGPGVKKQSCIERRCLRVLENRLQRDGPMFKAKAGCCTCDECLTPDCQTCLVCLDRKFFDNRYLTGAMCAKKRCNQSRALDFGQAQNGGGHHNGGGGGGGYSSPQSALSQHGVDGVFAPAFQSGPTPPHPILPSTVNTNTNTKRHSPKHGLNGIVEQQHNRIPRKKKSTGSNSVSPPVQNNPQTLSVAISHHPILPNSAAATAIQMNGGGGGGSNHHFIAAQLHPQQFNSSFLPLQQTPLSPRSNYPELNGSGGGGGGSYQLSYGHLPTTIPVVSLDCNQNPAPFSQQQQHQQHQQHHQHQQQQHQQFHATTNGVQQVFQPGTLQSFTVLTPAAPQSAGVPSHLNSATAITTATFIPATAAAFWTQEAAAPRAAAALMNGNCGKILQTAADNAPSAKSENNGPLASRPLLSADAHILSSGNNKDYTDHNLTLFTTTPISHHHHHHHHHQLSPAQWQPYGLSTAQMNGDPSALIPPSLSGSQQVVLQSL